ncbi:MAG: hypothetical protein QNK03_28270, partial [Myxococcota bacterium]|nr:hypothetical protein [Myxococcota bacterium]
VATRPDPWTDMREVMIGPGDPEGRADATFEAGRGFVVAVAAPRANSSCCDFPPTSGSGTGRTLAVLRVDDLVFSGPGADVETSLHLVFDGSYTEFAENIETATAQSSITVDLGGSLCNGEEYVGFRGTYSRVLVDDDGEADPRLVENRTGVFDGVGSVPPTGQTEFAVGPFTAPTGAPLTLEIWIEALLLASAGGGNARATGDFALALGALDSGEVFDLPEGYTANSATAGIVANQVPEPAAGATGAAGLLATAWLAWRSSRTRASRARRCERVG